MSKGNQGPRQGHGSGRAPLGRVRAHFWKITLAAAATLAMECAATAQNDSAMPNSTATDVIPMPPMRPATLMRPVTLTRPAPLLPPAPAPQPVLAAPIVPPGKDPMVFNFSPDMSQELPPASRAQMHKCGAEWQKMKASGEATDKTWRAFADVCLVQQANP